MGWKVPCRIYAPVGTYRDLLPYLVRRLLENGANSSFVNRLGDLDVPIEALTRDPIAAVAAGRNLPGTILPRVMFGGRTRRFKGLDFGDPSALARLEVQIASQPDHFDASPIVGGGALEGKGEARYEPADRRSMVGTVVEATIADMDMALGLAAEAQPGWDAVPVDQRAKRLTAAADLLEADMPAS